MKKILLTSLFVFGLFLFGTSVQAKGGEVHLVGKDDVVTNQLKYTQTLRRGTKNAKVLALQKKLKTFGFYHKLLDSDYGSGTIAAVKQFQRSKGLKVDGIAGPKTFAMIIAANASGLTDGVKVLPIKSTLIPDTKVCTKEYAPVCTQVDICKGKDLCPMMYSLPKTYSNSCMAKAAGAKILYEGECNLVKPIEDNMSDEATHKLIENLEAKIKRLENYINDLKDKVNKLKESL